MNAVQIIESVRAHKADLALVDDRLVVCGAADPLPDDLRTALSEHKTELMIALGAPIDRAIAGILNEIRPHLPRALRRLPDDRLLALVNWAIIAVWETAIRKVGHR